MSESPTKRRRLSPDTRESTSDMAEVTGFDTARPTTPKRRASYLSPTKASLARSHPNVFAKSPKRGSLTEPRGKLLRQELLGSRKSVSNMDSAAKTMLDPSLQDSNGQGQNEAPIEPDRDGFADAIAQSFQNATADRPAEPETRTTMRSPLLTRQPPNTVPNKRRRGDKDVSPTLPNFPVPTLVKRPDGPIRQKSEARNEPDLPPTPVQLGIGMAPDRPRGLASSSSIGSKSGSGRHRKRVRSGGAAITSSPLKPRNTRPVSPIDFSDVEEDVEVEGVTEAPESDVDEGEDQPEQQIERQEENQQEEDDNEEEEEEEEEEEVEEQNQRQEVEEATDMELDNDPTDEELQKQFISQKQQQGRSLRVEVQKLRQELASLESLAERLEEDAELDLTEIETELLETHTVAHKKEESLQSPDTHPLYIKNMSAYLGLFAPGNLRLKHETRPIQIDQRPKIDHKLILSAPTPWPPSVFQHSFSIRVDAEASRIEQIAQTDSSSSERDGLQKWIQSRLQDPLHQLNATGLIWGIGQYFQACTQRARFLRAVDELYNQCNPPPRINGISDAAYDKSYLSGYLHETHITVVNPDAANPSTTRKVRVDYHIDLTWTGDTSVRVEMALAGIGAKAQESAKELFAKLLVTEEVSVAFEHVCNMLGIEASGKGSMAARRVTEGMSS